MESAQKRQLDDLFDYWRLFQDHWRLIVSLTILAFAWVFVMTKFVATKWYESTAYIRPTPRQAEASELSSIAAAALGSGGGMLGGVLSMAGMQSEAQDRAEEYMSIIQGYAFSMELLSRHHLQQKIEAESKSFFSSGPMTRYQIYQAMDKRFECKYDLDTGNIELTFLAPSRVEAREILNFYIDDLQNKLRGREIQDASLAIKSLKQEAATTGDSLLQQDLYQLLARQVQRQQLAQIQADLAFSVIDPPVVPDKPYRPKVMLSSVIAAALAFVATVGGLIIRQRFSLAWEDYTRRRMSVAEQAPVDRTIALREDTAPISMKRSR